MLGRKTLNRLEQMLDDAIAGTFRESDYDETVLSRIESKWKRYLGKSVLAEENLKREKDNIQKLVSDISHQTKTPMANICLYAQLLGERMEGEENRKLSEELIRQTEKLEFLIRSLTKLSRLESNIVAVEPKFQALSGLLKEAVEDICPRAEKKGIQISCSCKGSEKAWYDGKWTKEALENILDNAVKYSPAGSEIFVTVIEYELYTAVAVKDYGIGIKEEDLPKIFGRFYRADTLQQEEGVGIGLYLAREILRRESGYIKVKSEPGKGSEFFLYLQKNGVELQSNLGS